jgi:glucose-6-phosphate 1-dehydrogenase
MPEFWTETSSGRTGFYDAYGVFRDVHQNHLTEVLALLMADEATSAAEEAPEAELVRKAMLLGQLKAGQVRALQ